MRKLVAFKTNARHVSQLGRELVTDYVTALVELVKNSYDADAEGVKIIFRNLKNNDGKIIIMDTGSGMTQKDIEEKWTVIGTNNKVRKTYSPKGRKYAGKKGIGRFAVERLAEKVTIYSISEKELPFKFKVNWNKYEEINISALKQRISLLKLNKSDISSARYINSHIDYFLSNNFVKSEDKKMVQTKLLENQDLNYTIFLNNEKIINILEEEILPIFLEYQDEEIRISDIYNEMEYTNEEESAMLKNYLGKFYRELSVNKDKETGLIMVLEGLRDNWRQQDITKLQKELRSLVTPDFLEKNPFKIKLETDEFELQDEIVMNSILDLHFAKVNAYLRNDGRSLEIYYKDKNRTIERKYDCVDEPYLCGDLELELYYFVRDNENLSNEVFNVTHARKILDEFCGVKIYRDGFHVKPYGDAGNDWLLLDNRKIKETHGYLVGNNQVIGIIKITEEKNPLLMDATNREGLLDNEAYQDLVRFGQMNTNLIANIRYEDYQSKLQQDRIIKQEEKKKIEDEKRKSEEKEREEIRKRFLEKNKEEIESLIKQSANSVEVKKLSNIADKIHDITENDILYYRNRLEEERRRNEEHYKTTTEFYNEAIENKERELNLYKNLASLGILTGSFGHETTDIISRIGADINYTRICYPLNEVDNKEDIISSYNQIEKDFSRIAVYSSLIVGFLKKSKRENYDFINFKDAIEEVAKLYENMLNYQNVELTLDLHDFESEFKMYTIDLESIVINMITNSFEAVKSKRKKNITISSKLYDGYYEMLFQDSGDGIKKEYLEDVFKPFKTTKEDGIGLGLNIVKDIVHRYNGDISVSNSSSEGGAIFSVKFFRRDDVEKN